MSGSYIYDVVWCGLEMIKINKQKQFSVTNYSSSRLLMPRGSSLNLVNNVSLTCLSKRIAFIIKFFNRISSMWVSEWLLLRKCSETAV